MVHPILNPFIPRLALLVFLPSAFVAQADEPVSFERDGHPHEAHRVRRPAPIWWPLWKWVSSPSATRQPVDDVVVAEEIGQAHVEPFVANTEEVVLDAHQFEDGGVQVVHVQRVLDRPEAKLISGTYHLPSHDAAAGHPAREAVGIVVTARASLGCRRSSKFTAPDNQCVVEHTAPFEVGEQCCAAAVDTGDQFFVKLVVVAMRIPLVARAAAVVDLHHAHAALHQSPRRQALLAKALAVQLPCRLRLA